MPLHPGATCHELLVLKGSGPSILNLGAEEPWVGGPLTCKATWGIFALEDPQVMSSPGVPSAGFCVSMGLLFPCAIFLANPRLSFMDSYPLIVRDSVCVHI